MHSWFVAWTLSRHFLVQALRNGQIPLIRPVIEGAYLEALVKKLETNDALFMDFLRLYENMLGHKIENVGEFIQALEGRISRLETLLGFAVPAAVKAHIESTLQAYRLLMRMAEQSV